MISRQTIDKGVAQGIITASQRDALLAIDKPDGAVPPRLPMTPGDENLRLIGGGNDLFVTVGIAMLFAGLAFVLNSVPGMGTYLTTAIVAVVIWLVAEFITRQKRMRLASTVLGLGFIYCIGALLLSYAQQQTGLDIGRTNPVQLFALREQAGLLGSLVLGGIALAAALYFWRFRVPVMAAVIALSLTALAMYWTFLFLYDGVTSGEIAIPALEALPQIMKDALLMPLACGVVVFLIAVMLDLHDRERFTVWSDCAFWLHVVSAPLLVHPLFILATGQTTAVGEIEGGVGAAMSLGLLILGFVYVALVIDRRSLLVPTFAYFGSLGVYYLFDQTANATGIPPFALILLLIGGLVILFGAGWQKIRALIVGTTLPTSVLTKLPPIKV